MAYFGAYEAVKILLTPKGGDPSQLNPGAVLVAGGSAGTLALEGDRSRLLGSHILSMPIRRRNCQLDCRYPS